MTTTLELISRPCVAPKPGLTGYKNYRCRCAQCTKASADYEVRRTRLIAYGRWDNLVDAEPVRQHIKTVLQPAGLGVDRITELAGLPPASLRQLIWPRRGCKPTQRMRRDRAAAVLAIQPDLRAVADYTSVDPTETRRKAGALAAIGWSFAEQARWVGRTPCNYARSLRVDRVTARVAREVDALFEQWAGTPAPDTYRTRRVRKWAREQGFAPPQAWDDHTIADPKARPDLGADHDPHVDPVLVGEVLYGRAKYAALNEAEQAELWRAWLRYRRDMGMEGPGLLEFRLAHGLTKSQVNTLRNRAEGRGCHAQPLADQQAA